MASTLDAFPLVFPLDPDETHYLGYLTIHAADYQIRVKLKSPNCFEDSEVTLDARLSDITRSSDYQRALTALSRNRSDIVTFLNDLQSVLSTLLRSPCHAGRDVGTNDRLTRAARVLGDLNAVGWDRVRSVDANLTRATLTDPSSGATMTLTLPPRYPTEAPIVDAELPRLFEFSWSPDSDDLTRLFDAFRADCADLAAFWSVMRDVDAGAAVLEPSAPSLADDFRRIDVGEDGVSLYVKVDPARPRDLPECSFLGPDHVVKGLQQKLQSRASDWDPTLPILTNLSFIVDVDFAKPRERSADAAAKNICGVCYTFAVESEAAPSIACEDAHCAQTFHKSCLFEWLKALPDCRRSFNTLFGDCPYCSKPIKVTWRP